MKISKYRIIKKSNGLFEIEEKGLVFGWNVIKEWNGCDLLGFDYGYSPVVFKTVEDAECYIKKRLSINEIIVIKEI